MPHTMRYANSGMWSVLTRSMLFSPLESLVLKNIGNMPKLLAMEHIAATSVSIPLSSELQCMTKPGYVEWVLSLERPPGVIVPRVAEEKAVQELRAWFEKGQVKPQDREIADCLVTYIE